MKLCPCPLEQNLRAVEQDCTGITMQPEYGFGMYRQIGAEESLGRDGMTVTVKDIARIAGVSTATVSRVINAVGNVSDEIRCKVLSVVSESNYCPNPHAAALGRSKGGVRKRKGPR